MNRAYVRSIQVYTYIHTYICVGVRAKELDGLICQRKEYGSKGKKKDNERSLC